MALAERQKAENKAAKRVCDRAYAAGKCEFQQAAEAAQLAPSVAQAAQSLHDAQQRADGLMHERDVKIKALQEQITSINKSNIPQHPEFPRVPSPGGCHVSLRNKKRKAPSIHGSRNSLLKEGGGFFYP